MISLLRSKLSHYTMTGQFRSHVWDPCLITAQIIAMQSQFYVALGLLVYIVNKTGNYDISLDQVLTYKDFDVLEDSGRVNVIAFLLNSLISALALWYIVQRTKQCLDFAITVHIYHIIMCWMYHRHFPHAMEFWVINVISVAIMTVSGEFLCMKSEMKAIPLSMGPKADL